MDIINNIFLNGAVVLFLFVTSFYLGLLAYSRNRKSPTNIVFTRFSVATALWILFAYVPDVPQFRDFAILSARLNYIALLVVGYSLFELPFVFPRIRSFPAILRYGFLTIGVGIGCLALFTNGILNGLEYYDWGASYIDGEFAGFFYLYMLIAVFSAIAQYIYLWRKFTYHEKTQVRLFLIGLSIFMATNIIVQSIVKPFITFTDEFYKVGNYSAIFMIVFTGYAIIKNRFMDIRLIVARSVTYTLLVTILGLFYASIVLFTSTYFLESQVSMVEVFIYVVLALFIAFTFQPLKRLLEVGTDEVFFKEKYLSNELVLTLTKIMASTFRLEELTKKTLRELLVTMRVTRGAFILFREDNDIFTVTEGYGDKANFNKTALDKLFALKRVAIFEEESEDIKQLMRKLDISIAVPLFEKRQDAGLLVLGEKKSGDMYSLQDIEVLEIFGPEVAVALHNAESYEEISKFNITLKDEVERATKDLKVANSKLKEMDLIKNEFVSVASHELRTPMTAIKSYLWMALEGKGGKLSEKQRYYIERGYNSVDRLIRLVNDMLNISRIESGKITTELQSLDLVQLAQEVVDEVLPRATEVGVKVVVEKPKSALPQVLGDPDKLKEVYFNLIGNSLKFTPKDGTVTVTFTVVEGMIETKIIDTGNGIDPEDLGKLFQKFGLLPGSYTTNQPAMGTGLGLYICREIITMHGGKIWAASEGKGKGMTVTFTLKEYNEADREKLSTGKPADGGKEKADLIHSQV